MHSDRPTAQHYLDGRWEGSEQVLPILEPATGAVLGEVSWGSAREAVRAADAATRALPAWAERPPRWRADLLREAADVLDARRDRLGLLLAREAGKRLPEALAEVSFSAEYFRWFAEEARRPHGQVIPHEAHGRRHLTWQKPIGVVATLTPWNFPCSIQARKLAPALAAGCTVVARVSEKAPLAVTEMIRALVEAGLPPGVLNLVHGPGQDLTEALVDHRSVRAVSFTGSTEVGRQIMARAARRVVRPLLELGGNAPFIVCADADIDAAVEGALIAKFRNSGQSCIAANHFLVHEQVAEEFTAKLASAVNQMSIGDGVQDPCPDLGPVIDDERVRAVTTLLDDALAAGAQPVTRSAPAPVHGSFVNPVLLTHVPPNALLCTTEVFGPAAAITTVPDDDAALELANQGELGLAGYFWSRDINRIWHLAERLDVGIIGANNALPSVAFAPMGGVKQSGLGREGADLGLADFCERRYLSLGLSSP